MPIRSQNFKQSKTRECVREHFHKRRSNYDLGAKWVGSSERVAKIDSCDGEFLRSFEFLGCVGFLGTEARRDRMTNRSLSSKDFSISAGRK